MSVSSWNKSHALSFRGCPAGSTLFLLVVLATRMKPEYSEWSLQSRVFFTEYHPHLLNTIITYNYPASTYIYIIHACYIMLCYSILHQHIHTYSALYFFFLMVLRGFRRDQALNSVTCLRRHHLQNLGQAPRCTLYIPLWSIARKNCRGSVLQTPAPCRVSA